MPLDEDMGVFFDVDGGHADLFVLLGREGEPRAEFPGIVGLKSRDTLEDHLVGTVRELRYPTASIVLGHDDVVVRKLRTGDETYRVRGEPDLQNDGAEAVVTLSEALP